MRILYQLPSDDILSSFIAQVYHFDAYGNLLNNGGTINPTSALLTRYLYSSEAFDFNIQLQYLRARFYDASNGRFNSLDPFAGNMSDPQSLHKYAYVHGDPIQGIDPTGMMLFGGFGGFVVNIGMRINAFMGSHAAIKGAFFGAAISTISTSLAKEAGMLDAAVSGVVGGAMGFAFGLLASYSQTAAALTGAGLMVYMAPYIYAGVKDYWQKGNYAKAVFDSLTVIVSAPLMFSSIAASAVMASRGTAASISIYTRSAAAMAFSKIWRSPASFRDNDGFLPVVSAGAYDSIAGQSAGGLSGRSLGATPTIWHPKVQVALREAHSIWVRGGRLGNEPGNCTEWRSINELAIQLGSKFNFGKHIKVQAMGTGTWPEGGYPLFQSFAGCKNCQRFLSGLVDLLPGASL